MLNLDEIRARCEAATPGPWGYDGMHNEIHCHAPNEEFFLITSELREHPGENLLDLFGHTYNPNFEFIAEARTDIPALIAEVERLTKERDAAVEWADDLCTMMLRYNADGYEEPCEIAEEYKKWRGVKEENHGEAIQKTT